MNITHLTRARAPNPLFLEGTTSGTGRYQSTCALLGYKVENGSPGVPDLKMARTVIDGGAARSGMQYEFLRQHFPTKLETLRPCTRRFHDANGRDMAVMGEVDFDVMVGECTLSVTFVYKIPSKEVITAG